jgi:hypothetical protein
MLDDYEGEPGGGGDAAQEQLNGFKSACGGTDSDYGYGRSL